MLVSLKCLNFRIYIYFIYNYKDSNYAPKLQKHCLMLLFVFFLYIFFFLKINSLFFNLQN